MPKNKIDDVRNLMIETIERLIDPEDPMDFRTANAVAQVGTVVVNSAKIELQAAKQLGIKPTVFVDSKPEPKLIEAGIVSHTDELENCKCGETIYPADVDKSARLGLGYPRCAECLSLMGTATRRTGTGANIVC
jgi:hypothetical protein